MASAPEVDKVRNFIPRRFRRRLLRDRQVCESVDESFDLLEAITLDSRLGIPFKGPRVPERQGLDLLEVFAYPGSRLTQAILEAGQGHAAHRPGWRPVHHRGSGSATGYG